MCDPQRLPDAVVEEALRANDLRFHAMGPHRWMLGFNSPGVVGGHQIHVSNGEENPGFLSVLSILLHANERLDCLRKASDALNARFALAKIAIYETPGGVHMVCRVVLPRLAPIWSAERLAEALKHAFGAVLAASNAARPVLECCMQHADCDPEHALDQAGPRRQHPIYDPPPQL